MEYTLIRSKRKSISIQITSQGDIVVRAPLKASQTSINEVIELRKSWITKHTSRTNIQRESIAPYLESLNFAEHEKEQFRHIFIEKLNYWSSLMGLSYSKLRMSGAKTRWGSCSSNGTISLNWKLGILPSELLEYVIIHELAHIKHMNHSKDFWNLVEQFCPEYKVMRNKVNSFSAILA